MNHGYPLLLDVAGRRVVVVGGGPVAARRARGLVDAGADVVLVSPWVCEDVHDLVDAGRLAWLPRDYTGGDLDDAWLAGCDHLLRERIVRDKEELERTLLAGAKMVAQRH